MLTAVPTVRTTAVNFRILIRTQPRRPLFPLNRTVVVSLPLSTQHLLTHYTTASRLFTTISHTPTHQRNNLGLDLSGSRGDHVGGEVYAHHPAAPGLDLRGQDAIPAPDVQNTLPVPLDGSRCRRSGTVETEKGAHFS